MTRPSSIFRAAIAIATLLGLASSAARAQQTAVIQAETRVVLVDAIVTGKKGDYIRDLEAKDFRVWEDNREQAIKSFSFEAASASAQPRYLILFFDNAGIEAGDQVQLQQAVSSFIDASAGPNRRMAVVTYNGTLRVAQQFTDNAGRLKDAVKGASNAGVSRGVTNAAGDLRARDMLGSLSALTRNLSALPGRKIVVLLTGGLSGSSDQRIAAISAIEAANMSGVAIYPIDVRPLAGAKVVNDNPDGPSYIDPSTGSPDRVGNGGPYSTARGSRGGRGPQGQAEESGTNPRDPGAGSQQILYALANGTGGFVIPNSTALLAGLQGIGEEQDEYYVLSFTPPESKEGSCHALRVKVDRKGTSVRSRSNYCTVKPPDLLSGTVAGKELENRAASTQTGSIAASIELPYFYLSPNVARVHVAMEIMPDALKFENQKGRLHAEIDLLGIASAPDGAVAGRFSDALKLDFDSQAQIEKSKGQPLHYEKEFKIAPGQYRFTIVFSSGGANFGKLEVPLVVDPWKAGELAVSSLALGKETRPATDLNLGPDVALIGDRTPLIAEGIEVVPSGSNQFAKSQPVFFYLEVYAPNAAPQAVRVRILDRRTGEPQWNSGLMKPSGPHQGGTIPVDSLAPGSYQLEVTIGNQGDKQVKRTTDFEIK